jgi:anti-sigma B factor antagonist
LNPNFTVTSESPNGVVVVNVSGELDQATAPQLREAFDAAVENDEAAVLVDLAGCEFIDSTGLSLLVEVERRLAEEKRGFGVCCARSEVARLLELTGIDSAVSLFESREDGLSALSPATAGD